MHEIIKLNIDEKGIKIENEGKIGVKKCKQSEPIQKKLIILNRPFWIVMR